MYWKNGIATCLMFIVGDAEPERGSYCGVTCSMDGHDHEADVVNGAKCVDSVNEGFVSYVDCKYGCCAEPNSGGSVCCALVHILLPALIGGLLVFTGIVFLVCCCIRIYVQGHFNLRPATTTNVKLPRRFSLPAVDLGIMRPRRASVAMPRRTLSARDDDEEDAERVAVHIGNHDTHLPVPIIKYNDISQSQTLI